MAWDTVSRWTSSVPTLPTTAALRTNELQKSSGQLQKHRFLDEIASELLFSPGRVQICSGAEVNLGLVPACFARLARQ